MTLSIMDTFDQYRPRIIGLIYRITGSASEAEDIAQDTVIKWLEANHETIHSPYAWLVTVATRLSLDYLKSSRVQRRSYLGPWLPEPFIQDSDTPDQAYELDQSVTMAMLVLIDQLTPKERVAFILHDVFQFQFDEVANILGEPTVYCRKLASLARKKIDRDKFNNDKVIAKDKRKEHSDIVSAFFYAVKGGDVNKLTSLLKHDVAFHADGGGKAPAPSEILIGTDAVSHFLMSVVMPTFADVDFDKAHVTYVRFNAALGLVVWVAAKPISAFNFEIDGCSISKIHVLRNPDKLKFFDNTNLH